MKNIHYIKKDDKVRVLTVDEVHSGNIIGLLGTVLRVGLDENPLATVSLDNGTEVTMYAGRFKPISNEDQVRNPSHYKFFDTEAIVIIRNSLNDEGWLGYCKGNALKYRLRAGKKDDSQQELDKANFYEELYEQYK